MNSQPQSLLSILIHKNRGFDNKISELYKRRRVVQIIFPKYNIKHDMIM